MDSGTLGGTIRQQARQAAVVPIREGRIARVKSPGLFEVAVRSLMGDNRTILARGPAVELDRGTNVWVSRDEGGQWVLTQFANVSGSMEALAADVAVIREAPLNVRDPRFATIQDAADALPSTDGHVYIPAGLYPESVVITGRSHLTISGDGPASVIHNTAAGQDALRLEDCPNATVRDLRVQGVAGTRDALSIVRGHRSRVAGVFSGGTGRNGIQAEESIGIVVDPCHCGPDTPGPYPAGLVPMRSGLVLTWDQVHTDSGCNGAIVTGGAYVIGQSQGFAVQVIRGENVVITNPIPERSGGGIYGEFCSGLVLNQYYGEQNPSDVEYAAGTCTVTAGLTAVVGVGTAWATNDGEGHPNAWPGKVLIIGTEAAQIDSVQDDTHLTLRQPWGTFGGSSHAGVAYRISGLDLLLFGCAKGTVINGRGGGAAIFAACTNNRIDLLTESVYFDANSALNEGTVRTNLASTASDRFRDNGYQNRIQQIDTRTGLTVRERPQAIYASQAGLPAAADNRGAIVYVNGNAAGSKFQGSDGSSWFAVG